MRFWDSSAVVPLLVREAATSRVAPIASEPDAMYVWWTARIEVIAALARRQRAGTGRDAGNWARCFLALNEITEDWREIVPSEAVRRMAERLLRRHDLRAADSLHLAAALVACDDAPGGHDFVCLDDRLRFAAATEGFRTLPP